jgi:putative tryptophan/tyrosine transport system substrate-binding protein
MDRRHFLVASLAGVFIVPRAAGAQTAGKVYRIGYLSGASLAANKPFLEQFQQELRKLGYAEGQNVVIEYRWAEGKQERLRNSPPTWCD